MLNKQPLSSSQTLCTQQPLSFSQKAAVYMEEKAGGRDAERGSHYSPWKKTQHFRSTVTTSRGGKYPI